MRSARNVCFVKTLKKARDDLLWKMVPTPRDDPCIAIEWRAFKESYFRKNQDATLEQVCRILSERYGCAKNTVRIHLDPVYAQRQQEVCTASNDRNKETRRLDYALKKVDMPAYPWRSVELRNQYFRHLYHLKKYPEEYLAKVFRGNRQADIETITVEMRAVFGGEVKFRLSTIQGIMRAYATAQRVGRIRGPPYLLEVKPGRWRYSTNEGSS